MALSKAIDPNPGSFGGVVRPVSTERREQRGETGLPAKSLNF